ncbi:MAG: hypothetical protein ACREQE_12335, partial [Candidatus Binataceae bacterium]
AVLFGFIKVPSPRGPLRFSMKNRADPGESAWQIWDSVRNGGAFTRLRRWYNLSADAGRFTKPHPR